MDSLGVIAVLLGLVATNALFVMAEFALVTVPRAQLDQFSATGSRRAARAARILKDPEEVNRFIATVQLGITAASLGLGMYSEHAIAERLYSLGWFGAHSVASLVAVLLLSYLHLVLGEVLPKSVALGAPLHCTLWLLPLMSAVQWLLYPLVAALYGCTNAVLWLLGVRRQSAASRYYDRADLQDIVEESHREGLLGRESGEVLVDLLKFSARTAGEAMVPRVRVRGIEVGSGPEQIRALLAETAHTRYPVYEGDLDHVLGVVHSKQLWGILQQERPVLGEDARKAPFVPETMRLDDVIARMRERATHVVIVMDEHGGTSGILTYEDLFEEVVGSIDEDPLPATRERGGALRVPGTLRLDELGKLLAAELVHPETDTVSGLVLMLLGRPARVGDVVQFGPASIEVVEVAGRGVKSARVLRIGPRPLP
jgi:CBS domain containing-hemolysin-like protein